MPRSPGSAPRSHNVQLTIPAELLHELRTRGESRSGTIRRDLGRLYTLYKHALREVSLSPGEAALICDALRGTLIDATSAALLWIEVADAIRAQDLDQKWQVDGPALTAKIRGLDRTTCLALVDAAERFRRESTQEDTRQAVRRFFPVRGE